MNIATLIHSKFAVPWGKGHEHAIQDSHPIESSGLRGLESLDLCDSVRENRM